MKTLKNSNVKNTTRGNCRYTPIHDIDSMTAYNMLKACGASSKQIIIYLDVVYTGATPAELSDKLSITQNAIRKNVRLCESYIKQYIQTCGIKLVPSVDDDILILGLPRWLYNALKRANVPSIEVLRLMDNEKLLNIRGVGRNGVNYVCVTLNNLGFEHNSRFMIA